MVQPLFLGQSSDHWYWTESLVESVWSLIEKVAEEATLVPLTQSKPPVLSTDESEVVIGAENLQSSTFPFSPAYRREDTPRQIEVLIVSKYCYGNDVLVKPHWMWGPSCCTSALMSEQINSTMRPHGWLQLRTSWSDSSQCLSEGTKIHRLSLISDCIVLYRLAYNN